MPERRDFMSRPAKPRFVCRMPKFGRFSPGETADGEIVLTVDEYEVIRLMDLENNTQESCAKQMHVARTTVQGIYETARRKLARAIVEGKTILISGGDYRLCEQYDLRCGRGCAHSCHRHRCSQTNEKII